MDRNCEGTFGNEAETYCNTFKLAPQPDGLQLLDQISITEGSKVLDLGCGTGNITVEIGRRVGSTGTVVGVDPDKERIRVAREKNAGDNVTYIEADGETFPEDQYDLVFSSHVLHWIENKDAVFKRVHKNLVSGGQFAFLAVERSIPIVDELSDMMGEERAKEIEQMMFTVSAEKYRELAMANSFTVTSMEVIAHRETLPNISSLIEIWFGITHGKFDPSLANEGMLKKFKQRFGDQPVEIETPTVRFVLTK